MPECKHLDTGAVFSITPNETILNAAWQAGVQLPYRCASGHCGLCRLLLAEGKVRMDHAGGISRQDQEKGYFLPCCSVPLGDIAIRNP